MHKRIFRGVGFITVEYEPQSINKVVEEVIIIIFLHIRVFREGGLSKVVYKSQIFDKSSRGGVIVF